MERAQAKAFALFSYGHSPLFALRYRGFALRLPPALRRVSRRRHSHPKGGPSSFFLSPLWFPVCVHVTLCARQVMTNSRDHRLHQSGYRLVNFSPPFTNTFFFHERLGFFEHFSGEEIWLSLLLLLRYGLDTGV